MPRRTIAGRYELIEQIGDSSWRATDTELGREVLIRLPAADIAAATLAHPNIVRIFDQGEEDGEPYAVLEYLPGGSLEQRLAAGPLTETEARSAAADLDAALGYAHGEGVTHGSLTSASVLFDGEGRAKLTGFTGTGTPEGDVRALAALFDVTEVMHVPPAATSRRRLALAAVVALVLVTAGVAAALLATSGSSSSDGATTSLSVPVPTASTATTTQETAVSTAATTDETTTQATTAPTTSAPTTTASPTTSAPRPATTAPPPTTEPPPPTTEPPPATTEEPPPPTTG